MVKPDKKTRVVIVGGGISGLTCAYKLSQSELFASGLLHIAVLESKSSWGGIITTTTVDDCILDGGPDSFITNKPGMLDLSRELKIDSRIVAVNQKNRGALIVSNGKLVPLPAGFVMLAPSNLVSFFQSSVLSWPGKLRSALDLVLPAKKDGADESLASFVRRRFGQEHLDKLAQPMVAGIYVGDAEKLSANHAAARFVAMERTAGSVIRGLNAESKLALSDSSAGASGARYSLFAGYDQGMSVVVDSLLKALDRANIDLCLNSAVTSIDNNNQTELPQFTVTSSGQVWPCEQLVLATSAKVSSALLTNVNGDLSRQLSKITSASSAVCNFIFDRKDITHPLNAFGVVVPEVEMVEHNLSLLAIGFASVKFARAPENKVIIRAFLGGIKRHSLLENDDRFLLDLALSDLAKLIGLTGQPLYQVVHRWPDSMPQYDVGHQNIISEIENSSSASALHLCGAYLHGVGLPDCVTSAYKCAQSVIDRFTQ